MEVVSYLVIIKVLTKGCVRSINLGQVVVAVIVEGEIPYGSGQCFKVPAGGVISERQGSAKTV